MIRLILDNTSAPSIIMIAEKGADLILKDWAQTEQKVA